LVSAPAGFEKTSLLASYYQQTDRASCGLTLSEEDRSVKNLLLHLVTVFRGIDKAFAAGLEESFQAPTRDKSNNKEN
jgi:ATP/maltotriose-dependent transcriptional regulator MalT